MASTSTLGPVPLTSRFWHYHEGGFGSGWLWTLTRPYSTLVSHFNGLLFAFVGYAVTNIVARSLELRRFQKSSTPDETTPLSQESRSGQNYGTNVPPPPPAPTLLPQQTPRPRAPHSQPVTEFSRSRRPYTPRTEARIVNFVGLVIALSFTVGSAFYLSIGVPDVGLAASDVCGMYGLRGGSTSTELDIDDEIQSEKERRAGQYARDCYVKHQDIEHDSDPLARNVDPDRCDFFYSSTIQYQISAADQHCPFSDADVCAQPNNAVKFSTGRVDVSVLGITSTSTSTFNRTTICTPLSMKSPYVDPVSQQNNSEYPIKYYYGTVQNGSDNITFYQYADPWYYAIPAYRITAIQATPYQELDYWTPIPALRPNPALTTLSNHTYTSIIFVEGCRIFYTGSSNDPIFPATRPLKENGEETGLWFNDDRRARPLACLDWLEVCQSNGICKNIDEESNPHEVEFEFVRSALRKSTIYSSLKFRLSQALMAQDKIGDVVSKTLIGEQWILESAVLFETSLSRIQYDTLDIAIGFGSKKGPYIYEEPDWTLGQMCGLYIFKLPQGYSNISVPYTLITNILLFFIALLGLPSFCNYKLEEKRMATSGSMLVGEWLLLRLRALFEAETWEWIVHPFQRIKTKIRPLFRYVHNSQAVDNRSATTTLPRVVTAAPSTGSPPRDDITRSMDYYSQASTFVHTTLGESEDQSNEDGSVDRPQEPHDIPTIVEVDGQRILDQQSARSGSTDQTRVAEEELALQPAP